MAAWFVESSGATRLFLCCNRGWNGFVKAGVLNLPGKGDKCWPVKLLAFRVQGISLINLALCKFRAVLKIAKAMTGQKNAWPQNGHILDTGHFQLIFIS